MYLVLRLCCMMMDLVNSRTPLPPYWLICPDQLEEITVSVSLSRLLVLTEI